MLYLSRFPPKLVRLLLNVHPLSRRRPCSSHNRLVSWSDRTHTCGELRASHAGQRVRLAGWVQYARMDQFLVLRDAHGLTQLVLSKEDDLGPTVPPLESVMTVEGVVRLRPPDQVNPRMPTGEVEVVTDKVSAVCEARPDIPFITREFNKAKEQTQMRYRYLALRDPRLQSNLRTRSALVMRMREFLIGSGFVDVDTPCLFRRTPGGAQEFVVPSRMRGRFYSLAQSPQQFKQLLMVGGLDRYFQIAKCFRDEGGKPDRQPEFTQVDIELSFTDKTRIMDLIERLLEHSWPSHLPGLMLPFASMTYADAMAKYGSDKPDLRYRNEIVDLTAVFLGGQVGFLREGWSVKCVSFNVKDGKSVGARDLKDLEADVTSMLKARYKSAGIVSSFIADGGAADGIKCSLLKKCPDSVVNHVKGSLALPQLSSVVGFLVVADEDVALNVSGHLRTELAKLCFELDPNSFEFIWIKDFPLFEPKDSDDSSPSALASAHHPFTRPNAEDLHLLDSSPLRVRGEHYDLVLNGQEVAGGSIRIHEADLQRKILQDILKEDVTELNHLLEALSFGCPPHGGIAIGLDRLLAIVTNSSSIREVIAFPKSADGRDVMSDSPAPISIKDKELYHISVTDMID